ncbi:MAG: LamG domain-containing protein [Gammaproteobacteria bacterium]
MCRKQMVVCFLILLVSLTLTSVVNAAWPGLVAHWRLDEGTGSTAGDASGNGHTGTLNGGATWVAGKLDGGVYLDGVDDYIEIPNVLSETGTLAFWFKPDWDGSDPEDYRLFDASLGGIYFFISKGANHADINPEDFGFYLEDGTDADYQGIEIDPAGVITANTWFHLAVTWEFSGGPAILYLDGEEIARADTLGPFPALNPNPRFGLQTVDYIPSAHGAMSAIDDIMIFDKVLLPAEIPVMMQGLGNFPYAWNPSPLDGAIVSETWVSLGTGESMRSMKRIQMARGKAPFGASLFLRRRPTIPTRPTEPNWRTRMLQRLPGRPVSARNCIRFISATITIKSATPPEEARRVLPLTNRARLNWKRSTIGAWMSLTPSQLTKATSGPLRRPAL